ncbi:hypothetical protein [Rufibacter soli]
MAKLTKSIKRANGYSQGGLVAIIAFATFAANGVTLNATPIVGVDGVITDLGLEAGVVPVTLESEIDKANYSANLTVGAGRYIAQSLGYTLAGVDQVKSTALEDIDLVPHTFVVKDRRGKCFILGQENGLIATQNNAGSGTAAGDLNGFDVILGGAENGRPREVSLAAFAALSVLVTT